MTQKNYGLVGSIEELTTLVDKLMTSDGAIGLDIETGYHGEDREKGSIYVESAIVAGISFTDSPEWARYVPLGHDVGENIDNVQAARLFWPVLRSGRVVAHNAHFELRHLSKWFRTYLSDDPEYGEEVRASRGYFPIRSDTQIEAYLVAEYQFFGLKPLTEALFGHKMTELFDLFEDLPKNRRRFLRFNVLELTPKVVSYACEDAAWCLAIHQKYFPQVKDTLLFKVEKSVVQDVLPPMEDFGIRYDWAFLDRARVALEDFKAAFNGEIMQELSAMAGEQVGINLGSPAQIGKVLYEQLGMRTTVYTPKTRNLPKPERKMSTSTIALAALAREYPVVKKVLQFKEITKLIGSYLDKYEKAYGFCEDGMVHPNHLSAFVVTGRFACSDPNYQQSPKKYHFDLEAARQRHAAHAEAHPKGCTCKEYAPPTGTCFQFNFRDAITAPSEHYVLGFDLSQAELRAIAGEAEETALLRAFDAGDDVHTVTAALMLGLPIEDVTAESRAIGKTMNFALLYGMGPKSLADRLALPVDEAKVLYDKYFSAYPNIAAWSSRQRQRGRNYGYVTSRFGRKMPVWDFARAEKYRAEARRHREAARLATERADPDAVARSTEDAEHADKTASVAEANGDRACVNYPIQGAATGDYMKIAMVRAHHAIRKAGLDDRVHLVMNVHDALEFYVHTTVPPQDVIKVLQPAVIFPVTGWPAMKADWHVARKWGSPRDVDVHPDGRITVKGEKEFELALTVDQDEETGEELPVLPDVDVELLRRVASERAVAGRPRKVVVELADMPTMDAYADFITMLDALAGANEVIIRTPEGELQVASDCGLTPDHLAKVSLLLGPSKMYFADFDAEAAVTGITF